MTSVLSQVAQLVLVGEEAALVVLVEQQWLVECWHPAVALEVAL